MRRVLELWSVCLLLLIVALYLVRQQAPLPQWIYFERDNQLYRVRWNGKHVEALPLNEMVLQSISPDGQWLLWSSTAVRRTYLSSIDLAQTRLLTDAYDEIAAWSPDSKQIAASPLGNMMVFDVALNRWLAPNVPTYYEYNVRWSPDGQWLLFEGTIGSRLALFRVRPDGTDFQEYDVSIPDVFSWSINFQWSPDGEWIAFSRETDGISLDLYLMRADGTELQNLTNTWRNDEKLVGWSDDGKRLIYKFDIDELRQRKVDGSGEESDTRLLSSPALYAVFYEDWIIYSESHNNLNIGLFRFNIDTGETIQLTSGTANDIHPAIVPPTDLHWQPLILAVGGVYMLGVAAITLQLQRRPRAHQQDID